MKHEQTKATTLFSSTESTLKIIVIGNPSDGIKTHLISRFCDNNPNPSFITTVGIDFKMRSYEINGHRLKYQIWDTAGQERHKTITTAYYRGTHAIILMYDITNRESFDAIRKWNDSVLANTSNVPRYLVGGCPKGEAERQVMASEGLNLATELGNIPFCECSVVTGQNVEALFAGIGKAYISKIETAHAAAPRP